MGCKAACRCRHDRRRGKVSERLEHRISDTPIWNGSTRRRLLEPFQTSGQQSGSLRTPPTAPGMRSVRPRVRTVSSGQLRSAHRCPCDARIRGIRGVACPGLACPGACQAFGTLEFARGRNSRSASFRDVKPLPVEPTQNLPSPRYRDRRPSRDGVTASPL